MLLYSPAYEPAFRLVAVCPDGFDDFAFLQAKLDRLLARKGPVQLLHWGCPLLQRYGAGWCQTVRVFPPTPRPGDGARAACAQAMVNQGQALAAFTDGGRDIEDLIRRAWRRLLPMRVIWVPALTLGTAGRQPPGGRDYARGLSGPYAGGSSPSASRPASLPPRSWRLSS
jgi:hypothetical protein